jgi:quinol monooxygenase YgiN
MIRVLIERRLVPGSEERLRLAMRELRQQAMDRDGYISGETHRDVADPSHYLILSTWRSRDDWDTWARSEARRLVEARMAPMLTSPERVTVLEPV